MSRRMVCLLGVALFALGAGTGVLVAGQGRGRAAGAGGARQFARHRDRGDAGAGGAARAPHARERSNHRLPRRGKLRRDRRRRQEGSAPARPGGHTSGTSGARRPRCSSTPGRGPTATWSWRSSSGSRQLFQVELGRGADVGLEDPPHLVERARSRAGRGGDAVARGRRGGSRACRRRWR